MPNTEKNFVKVPELSVRAIVQPETLNEEARTFEVCFGSDTPVRTRTWEGPVWEILSFEKGHVNLTRMQSGAPFLDNHNRYGSVDDNVLGVIDAARTDGKKGYCVVRMARDEKGDKILAKVKDGILRNVSVGYNVQKYERTKASGHGEMDTLRAIEWEPYEVSLVPVQADQKAQVRADQKNDDGFSAVEYVFTNHSHNTTRNMEKGNQDGDGKVVEETTPNLNAERAQKTTPENPPVVEAADQGNATRAAQAAVVAERTRVREIGEAVRAAGLDSNFADTLIHDGTGIDKARALIIDKWAEQSEKTKTVNASAGRDIGGEGQRAAAEDALYLRAEPGMSALDKTMTDERRRAADSYRGLTLLDLAKRSLIQMGINPEGMDKMEIAKRAISSSTSDFPVLLEGTNRRVLLASYSSMPDTWRQFATVGSVSDFRVHSRLRMGTFSKLDKLNENGQYKNKPIPDAEKEGIYAETFGNTINVSRKMIVNDDLAGFTRLASMLGRAAARSIEIDVYAMFALNSGNGPTMGDGNPLFHASHNNIAAVAAAPSIAAFDAARIVLATQKDPQANDFLDLRPSLWLGPIGLGGTVRVINEAQYDVDVSSKFQVPNKVRGLFGSVVDSPRLSGTPWYMLANPNDEPVFEVAFLDGVQTPFIEQDMPFEVDGIQWKIRLDYGVGAIGWRGIVKNVGA